MPDFDYIIIGGGCAGLSLAYNLEINGILATKSLAIIDPRDSYFRDKSWSFWKIFNHNFEDCVIKNWYQFDVKIPNAKRRLNCKRFPYQMIDSGLFYEKILDKLDLHGYTLDEANITVKKFITQSFNKGRKYQK